MDFDQLCRDDKKLDFLQNFSIFAVSISPTTVADKGNPLEETAGN